MRIIDKQDIERREEFLLNAFDTTFRKSLEEPRKELKKLFLDKSKSIKRKDNRIDNVFDVQSRIKEIDTFREKIYRKNYILDWDVYDDVTKNQEIISQKLPDLIGIRINCYFADYEKILYDSLLESGKKEQIPNVDNVKEEKTTQKNGHPIYKFSGRYKGLYHFEVQIKSIVHNVWGEVEHKTVYKNPNYDGFIEKKRELTDALHEILFSSDSQLLSIFKMSESEQTLIESLFYLYTKDQVKGACKTDILAMHYKNYFQSFDRFDLIKEYVSRKMGGHEFSRRTGDTIVPSDKIDDIKEAVEILIPRFYIDCLYQIDCVILDHKSYDSFLYDFINQVIPKDDEDDGFLDIFGSDETPTMVSDKKEYKDLIIAINGKLGNCIEEDIINTFFENE